MRIFPEKSKDKIKTFKFLRDTKSLYIGTEESVMRIPVPRCKRLLTKSECLNAMDPYCGWDEYKTLCTTAPDGHPEKSYWHQEKAGCPKRDMPVDGGWSVWSGWFECSQVGQDVTGDRCLCQKRQCNSPTPVNGGKDCEGTSVHVSNCTRDGEWTNWSSWSPCSQSCGLAVKSRRRVCGNPVPAFGGKICIGKEKDEIFCTTNPPCPASAPAVHGHWSEWSTWDECSAPCGGGVQVRRRRCNSPPPAHGGRECAGCAHESGICNRQPCPEVRKATPWTPFMRLNRTRDGYFEQRLRFSCRANLPDEAMLKMGSVRREERFCRDGARDCLDSAFLSVDGGWSAWTSWSYCSASCGSGVQYKERVCDSPRPTGNGAECVGPARLDQPCNTEPCQDAEGWEEWSVWSLCDENQEQQRRRKCRLPQAHATYCIGPTKEIRMCLPAQQGAASTGPREDGVHAEHIAGAFVLGLLVGALLSALALYFYTKRRGGRTHSRVATQLIPVKPNTYVAGSDWKNNYIPQQKIPLREATIKRNGTLRAQLQADNF